MEYEIYLLCNILGIIILFLIIIFHFIDADHENAKSFEKESGISEEQKQEKQLKDHKNQRIKRKNMVRSNNKKLIKII